MPLRSRAPRGIVHLLFVLLIAGSSILISGTPASAHDRVESSDPAQGAALETPPRRVSITLSQPPQAAVSVLTVVGPDGQRYDQGRTTVLGDVISVELGPMGSAGVYEVGYRIGSSDGHPITGAIAFRLTTSSSAAPPPGDGSGAPANGAVGTTEVAPSTAQPARSDADGLPAWPFVMLAVVVVGAALAVVLRRRV